jgi:hypothetical protein
MYCGIVEYGRIHTIKNGSSENHLPWPLASFINEVAFWQHIAYIIDFDADKLIWWKYYMLVQTDHAAEILVAMLQQATSDYNCSISIMLAL